MKVILFTLFSMVLTVVLGAPPGEAFEPPVPSPKMDIELLAEAQEDGCFFGIGNPSNFYDPELHINPGDCGGILKKNASYPWGMTKCGDKVWVTTVNNLICQASASTDPTPFVVDYFGPVIACEFAESQYVLPPLIPPELGDWRPSSVFMYDLNTGVLEDMTDLIDPSDKPLLDELFGFRSMGSHHNVVFAAGPTLADILVPDIEPGIIMVAYNKEGVYLGARKYTEYTNIRKWIVMKDVLYTTGRLKDGRGVVLRWQGDEGNPFNFQEVAYLPSEGVELAIYMDDYLVVSTWPNVPIPDGFGPGSIGGVDLIGSLVDLLGVTPAGVYISPRISSRGLRWWQKFIPWKKVMQATDYEPDFLMGYLYGMGAMAYYDGYLYFGTMQLPEVGSLVHGWIYGEPETPEEWEAVETGRHRALSLFRAKNLEGSFFFRPQIELLYGEEEFPVYNMFTGEFTDEPNKMGTVPLYGHSGFDWYYNLYTWTMAVADNSLFIGTLDFGFIYGDENLDAWGADMWRFDSSSTPAVPENINGLWNPAAYGIRVMFAEGDVIYAGTSNPTNFDTFFSSGGWQLRKLTPMAP